MKAREARAQRAAGARSARAGARSARAGARSAREGTRRLGPDQRERGVVLLLVLVILVLTITTVYAFARTAFLDVMSSRQRVDRLRAQFLARSGLAVARQALADDLAAAQEDPAAQVETRLDAWALVTREPLHPDEVGEVRISILDTGSRVNLNGLVDENGAARPESLDFLRAALERVIEDMPGRKEEKFYDPEKLTDAILDWMDADDRTRLGDEEAQHYARPGQPAAPLDRPLFGVGELREVPGCDERLVGALSHYFTAQPLFVPVERAGVNPNTAPPHVLGLIFHGGPAQERRLLAEDADDVARLLRLREDGRVFCDGMQEQEPAHPRRRSDRMHSGGQRRAREPSEARAREACTAFAPEVIPLGDGVFPPLQFQSDVFRIESEGRYLEARARLVAVIDRAARAGEETLYYRMD